MQNNLEAPVGCLKNEESLVCQQSKAYPYKLQDNGASVEDFPELKNTNTHPGSCAVEPASSLSNESFAPLSEGYCRSMYQQDFCMWSTFHPEYHKVQQKQWNGFEGFNSMNREYHFPIESSIQYVPFRMLSQWYPQDFQFQDFQYFVVIDFEATCDKDRNPHPQEIIEFPSVLVNSVTGQLEASFQTYVRPVYHQHLSDFCKELTGIQQIQVDRGVPLSEALLMHDKWLEDKGIKHTNFAVVTWSNWDCRVMLESECRFKRIRKPPYFNRWINLKVPFHEVFGALRCNLKEAVQHAGLAWEGRAHCGLDDAKNTARLLTHIMHRGFRFSITNSLMWHTAESQFAWHQSPDRPIVPAHYLRKTKPFPMPFIQFYPAHMDPNKERRIYCYCGVKTSRRMVRKPGPDHGSFYFGCGNWTAARGAVCPYFEWASP
ncbi:Eri1 exoribonuclease [Thalictrum thalictroides]|uniref:Eri1 exoribonuclease n=1 Tax=Thalictrum thalictroides TaxID=46969 RepID=A0A7J6WL00_THATH|nr:Eri1 exoribonuclease [Thalictrum thalictroides]